MAITIDAGSPYLNTQTGTFTTGLTVTPANGVGNAWVAIVSGLNSTLDISASTMTGGGLTWTRRAQAKSATFTNQIAEVWTASGAANGTAITWKGGNFADGNGGHLEVWSFSGSDSAPAGWAYPSTFNDSGTTSAQQLAFASGTLANSLLFLGGVDTSVGTAHTALANTTVLDDFADLSSNRHWTARLTAAAAGGAVTVGSSAPVSGVWYLAGVEIKSGATGAALAGAGTANSKGSASLTTGIALAAAGASKALGVAALTTGIALAAAGMAASSGTSAFASASSIAASGSAGSRGTAALTTGVQMAAAGQGSASGTASLTTGIPLAAAGTAASSGTAVIGSGSTIPAMSRLQVGKTVLGVKSPGLVFDGNYRYGNAWGDSTFGNPALASGDYAAVDLGASAPTKLFLVISNESQTADFAPDTGTTPASPLTAYHIDGTASTTTGADGSWTRLVTVTGNVYKYREHLVDASAITGFRYLRLTVDVAGAIVDELDIWDATNSHADTWMLLGDSITARAASFRYNTDAANYDVWPSFGEDTRTTRAQYPAQIGAGFLGTGANFLRNGNGVAGRLGISAWLTDFPDVKYWAVSIGTNDAQNITTAGNLASWLADMRAISASIKAAGRIPILARIPYSTDVTFGGGTYGTDNTHYLNVNGVDVLTGEGSFLAGPDLYTYFGTHQIELTGGGGDGTHPSQGVGCPSWNRLWSASVQSLYGAAPVTGIAASGTGKSTGTASLTTAIPLAATGKAASTGTVVLGGAAAALAAPGTAISSATAALTTGVAMSAPGTGASTGSAALTTAIPLVAAGQGASSATAAFAISGAIAASGTASSSGTASLVTGVALAAAGQGASTGTGTLTTGVALQAQGVGAGIGTAALTTGIPLLAAGQGASSATAAFATGGAALAASGASASSGAAALTTGIPLVASGSSSSAGTALLAAAAQFHLPSLGTIGGTRDTIAVSGARDTYLITGAA